MTATDAAAIRAEDIEVDTDTTSARLDREADAFLLDAETRALGPRPLGEALREDAVMVWDWGRERAERLRGAVESRPVKATLYAIGLGVIVGLLIAR